MIRQRKSSDDAPSGKTRRACATPRHFLTRGPRSESTHRVAEAAYKNFSGRHVPSVYRGEKTEFETDRPAGLDRFRTARGGFISSRTPTAPQRISTRSLPRSLPRGRETFFRFRSLIASVGTTADGSQCCDIRHRGLTKHFSLSRERAVDGASTSSGTKPIGVGLPLVGTPKFTR